MNIAQLYHLINNSDALETFSVSDLQRYIGHYPYFQTAKILLLKKMKLEENLAFDRELKKSAVYIADRAKLYAYLNPVKVVSSGGHEGGSLFDDHFISQKQDEDNYSSSSDASFNYLFLSPEEEIADTKEEVQDVVEYIEQMEPVVEPQVGSGWNLIDQFVNSEYKKMKVSADTTSPHENLAEASVKVKPAILTETLAKIYVKQQKYKKAIGIFESLSLKFPEKSAYFADRIEEIKQTIKNS